MTGNVPEAVKAIERFAGSSPHATALIAQNSVSLTYGDFWKEVSAASSKLQECEIEADGTVGVLTVQGPAQIIAITGVLNYCTCVPLQPKLSVSEIQNLLQRVSASALIVSPEFEAEAEAALAIGLTVIVARDDEYAESWKIRRPASSLRVTGNSSGATLILVTSATTGQPKLAPLTPVNLDAGTTPRCKRLQLKNTDRMLLMTPWCHCMGIETALAQFQVGGTVIATAGFDAAAYSSWIHDLRPTWYDCAPTVHRAALVELKKAPLKAPTSLRFLLSAGAPLPQEVRVELEQMLGVPLFNDYGATEAGPIASDAFLDGPRIPDSVGRTCGLEIGVMAPTGEMLSAGIEGEIAVRGLSVIHGYVNGQQADRSSFRDTWFCTGDAGRLDLAGNLYVTGRFKEIINRGGEKIDPAEVDAAIKTHPAVSDAAAFGVPHPTLGEDVACAVVLRTTSNSPSLSAMELRRFAVERLARFKVPYRIHFVEAIPRSELGKAQRWLLTEQFKNGNQSASSLEEVWNPHLTYVTNDLNYKIREIWGRILDRDDVGLHEDFFEAGGDSLAAINMLVEVDQRCGSNTSESIASFLDEPTIGHLTELVGMPVFPRPTYGAANEMQIFPVRSDGVQKRIYCIPADEDEGLYFRRLAKHLQGEMDLSIVRPASTFYSRSLFAFEDAAAEAEKLIVEEQAEGPYLLAGYCFGGIVAYETAQRLSTANREVMLILFDTPTPGHPSFLDHLRNPFAGGLRKTRESPIRVNRDLKKPTTTVENISSLPPRIGGRALDSVSLRLRRSIWYAVSHNRNLIRPFEHLKLVRRLLESSQEGYFPFFKARPIHVPILHFLCRDEPDSIQVLSRAGWGRYARKGIDERRVPLSHYHLLHESNLPQITQIMLQSIKSRTEERV